MMGPRQVAQGALFYEFSLEAHVPADHLLRRIDRFVDLSRIRRDLAPFYSAIGRPSIDPELMIRNEWGQVLNYQFFEELVAQGRLPSLRARCSTIWTAFKAAPLRN